MTTLSPRPQTLHARLSRADRLAPPPVHLPTVERQRLLERLRRARDRRVVVLCAPAGFGKTLLARQLVDDDSRPARWISLEENDNDPLVLVASLITALESLGPVDDTLAAACRARAPRLEQTLLPRLADELARREPFLLVLDDTEALVAPEAHAVLESVITAIPAGGRIVLAGRAEPCIPLAQLRAAGDVLELRSSDLALDPAETRELLERGGLEPDEQEVLAVHERSEGWAAGIALALLFRRDAPFSTIAIGRSPEIARYLLEEAVDRQPAEVRDFLRASSLLRRMSVSLCDAVLDVTDAHGTLELLEHESLFIMRDGDGADGAEWFRYHNLFRELLREDFLRREPARAAEVLIRASRWHAEQGDSAAAFSYAHEAGDLRAAGRIALACRDRFVERGRVGTLVLWMNRLTPDEIVSTPELAIIGGWTAVLTGDAAEAGRRIAAAALMGDQLDQPSADGASSLRASLANLRAVLAPDGVAQMQRDGRSVVDSEHVQATRWELDGWRAVAISQLLDGRPDDAIAAFEEIRRVTRGCPELVVLDFFCLGYGAIAATDLGDWDRARRWAQEAHALASDRGVDDVAQAIVPATARALVLQHDGLPTQSQQALAEAVELLPMVHAVRWLEADVAIRCAGVRADLGDLEGAVELADIARSAVTNYPDAGTLPQRIAALDERLFSGRELGLTPAELRLLPLLASHFTLQEIADRLYLSRATVKTHTVAIYRKLDVSSRAGVIERLEPLGFYRGSATPAWR